MTVNRLVTKLAAVALLVAAGAVTAAPVSLSGYYAINSASDFTITTSQTRPTTSAFYYQLTVGLADVMTQFSLLDTAPEGRGNISYSIYTDLDMSASASSSGILLKTASFDDVLDVAAAPFFQQLLESGKQYVLKISGPGNSFNTISTEVSAVPLPGAIWMFGTALLGFLGFSSRRKV